MLIVVVYCFFFFFSSRRRHTRSYGDWSSDVCSSDLENHALLGNTLEVERHGHARRVLPVVPEGDIFADDPLADPSIHKAARSEERRVGKECRSRWSP